MTHAIELDLRGLKCPMPVLRTRKALRRMVAGQRLVVFATDPLASIDIPNLVREQGDTLERATQVEGLATFWIVRSGAPADGPPGATDVSDHSSPGSMFNRS